MATTDLIDLVVETTKNAYVPYSHFPVGAVLVAKNGQVFTGVNVENASFGFEELIVYGETEKPISPCGACRQVMAEFFNQDLPVTLVAKDKSTVVMTVKELLPYSFTDLT